MKCKECDYELSNDATFCGKCGKPVLSSGNKIKCEECGYKIDGNLNYCPKCGGSTSSYDTKRNRRDKKDDDDDDDEGGILGGIGDIVGKLFG
jgi:RNA polymerase subunit RPABC4/transcription elongation factor Spt4